MLRLDASALDYTILAIYFLVVLGIGAVARLSVKTDIDFFLSGRSLPAWITGLAFVAANLGALEILGMAANGAQYGVATVHFYWIGAVPAMIFLGIVMMPFYYGAKVRSVPEYLRLRFNEPTHALNAATFAVATVLIAGVNLFALALIVHLMLGWSITTAIVVAAAIVLAYITLGGLTSAIYNEVLQFFIIVAALLPLTLVALHDMGGWSGLEDKVRASGLKDAGLHAWQGLAVGNVTNPIDANWIAIVFGLGFVLSFGYWTTNFAEVQRALSAKNLSAARRTPLIGAYPKIFIPALTIIPGLVALVTVKGLGGKDPDLQYNNAIPLLIGHYFPEGMLGLAVTGLLAAFMAGVAANVTSFNTVFTYDLWQSYVRPGRDDRYYLRIGRLATVGGLLIAVATAFIAKGYDNIMNYVQLLFSYFNAPLFATFIIAMFWKRSTPWAGFWGLIAGFLGAFVTHELYSWGTIDLGSALAARTRLGSHQEGGGARGARPGRRRLVPLRVAARRRRARADRDPVHHLHLGAQRWPKSTHWTPAPPMRTKSRRPAWPTASTSAGSSAGCSSSMRPS
jgi:SSS family solute:Na+ symporter